MIGMAVVGAAIGAVLLFLVLKVFPPKRSAIVQLGQYYAHYRGPEVAAAPTRTAADARGRIGEWVTVELAKRGIQYNGLRRDLALTGQSLESLMGRKVVAAGASPNDAGDKTGFINRIFIVSHVAGQYRRRFKRWNRTIYRVTKTVLLLAVVAGFAAFLAS